jgi:nitrous oxidase accessory protein NosD
MNRTTIVIALAATLAVPAHAASLSADPNSLAKVFASAKGGDVIVLAPGDYKGVQLAGRTFSPALTLDAAKARIIGLEVRNLEGLVISGGVFQSAAPGVHPRTGQAVFRPAVRIDNARDVAVRSIRAIGPGGTQDGDPFGEGTGISILRSGKVEVIGGQFRGFRGGVVLSKVDGFRLMGNQFTHMRSDGIQVGEGRNGLIEGNSCAETRIRDQEHPDCIQMWSRPTSLPTADVIIRGNKAVGKMQGIGLFNHVRNGVDDGGFDRIVIEDNDLTVAYPHGIALYASRDSVVRNNRVKTMAGARWIANINIKGETRVTRCGNLVAAGAGRAGSTDARCAPH